ncbi:MAG: DNA repair protein RecO [Pseudomonadales bacterium]
MNNLLKAAAGALEPCYVLHSRKYRDTSLILELFGKTSGRHAVVARGARGAKSKLRGRLQPFAPLLVSSRGRADLKTCTKVDFGGNAFSLKGERLILGLYINELLYRLLGLHDPMLAVFSAYEKLLGELQASGQSLRAIRQFELLLLSNLGYGVDFASEAGTGKSVSHDGHYRYVAQEGFYPVAENAVGALSGADLLAMGAARLDEVDEAVLRRITRQSIRQLLGDKPLQSRALFKGLPR